MSENTKNSSFLVSFYLNHHWFWPIAASDVLPEFHIFDTGLKYELMTSCGVRWKIIICQQAKMFIDVKSSLYQIFSQPISSIFFVSKWWQGPCLILHEAAFTLRILSLFVHYYDFFKYHRPYGQMDFMIKRLLTS